MVRFSDFVYFRSDYRDNVRSMHISASVLVVRVFDSEENALFDLFFFFLNGEQLLLREENSKGFGGEIFI